MKLLTENPEQIDKPLIISIISSVEEKHGKKEKLFWLSHGFLENDKYQKLGVDQEINKSHKNVSEVAGLDGIDKVAYYGFKGNKEISLFEYERDIRYKLGCDTDSPFECFHVFPRNEKTCLIASFKDKSIRLCTIKEKDTNLNTFSPVLSTKLEKITNFISLDCYDKKDYFLVLSKAKVEIIEIHFVENILQIPKHELLLDKLGNSITCAVKLENGLFGLYDAEKGELIKLQFFKDA